MNKFFMKHKSTHVFAVCWFVSLTLYFYFLLPVSLFDSKYSSVIYDRNTDLLAARIAADGQWRFPPLDTVPHRLSVCIKTFEDKRFEQHSGVDILALSRAIKQNTLSGRFVSGGSTITMQLCRLVYGNQSRTILQKIREILLAWRIEIAYNKQQILAQYLSHAPFGGNVVGCDAAAWRYFGQRVEKLTWAESSLLAVLPNSPSLIHLSRNRDVLLQKRNRLLEKLHLQGLLDADEYDLALQEQLPDSPRPFPQQAIHVASRPEVLNTNNRIYTTLDRLLQQRVNELLQKHIVQLKANYIENAAAIVIEVESGNVLVYCGNVMTSDTSVQNFVDIIKAPRSTGSILKPFLYAAMLTSGQMLSNELVADIPTQIGGYRPENYNRGYEGAIQASRALARSLNVPAVRMLQVYGDDKFYSLLQRMGMTTLTFAPEHYGLSLILGGCEGSLWDISGMYASMARSLLHYPLYSARYDNNDYRKPRLFRHNNLPTDTNLSQGSVLSAASIWFTFNAMIDVERPEDESNWQQYTSSEKIAWKTGTSFGFRDAWAVGVTPRYVVGVWVGNADGEGRTGIVGVKAAAPVLFDIFSVLPDANRWFDMPYDDMTKAVVCRQSGFPASHLCSTPDTVWIQQTGMYRSPCPYHRTIHTDAAQNYQLTADCANASDLHSTSWFVLPPVMEWYFERNNAWYKKLPPFRADCSARNDNNLELIYPTPEAKIFIPIELDGSAGAVVFEAAHSHPETIVYWHIDGKFTVQTQHFHQIKVNATAGWHTLSLVDQGGETIETRFFVMERK